MGVYRKIVTARNTFKNWSVFVGDRVYIREGKDKGQKGVISRIIKDTSRVVVEGKNLNKKAIRRQGDIPGGIITIESPMHVSNVQVVDPVTDGPVRISWGLAENGEKIRIGKGGWSSGNIIPIPDEHYATEAKKPNRPFEGMINTCSLETSYDNTREGEDPDTSLLAHAMELLHINTKERIMYDLKSPYAKKNPETGLTRAQTVRLKKVQRQKHKQELEKLNPKLTMAERRAKKLLARKKILKARARRYRMAMQIVQDQKARDGQQQSL